MADDLEIDLIRFEWESPTMASNEFEIFSNGLRFVYKNNNVFVFNAEATHNLIHRYELPGVDTRINFEKEIAFWLYDNSVLDAG